MTENVVGTLLDGCIEHYREQYGLRYVTPARSVGIAQDDQAKVAPTWTPLRSSPHSFSLHL